MPLDKSTLALLEPHKSEEKDEEPRPDWYMTGSRELKCFYDAVKAEYQRVINELKKDPSPANARKIESLNVSTDDSRAYFNRKYLIETINEGSNLKITRSLTNKSTTTPQVKKLINQLDIWDSEIQSVYKPIGKLQTSINVHSKARRQAEKSLKEFDIELAEKLSKSLQDNMMLKAANETKTENQNLVKENSKLMSRIQDLEIANASYEKQLAQASSLNKKVKRLEKEVARLTAENALLKSSVREQ